MSARAAFCVLLCALSGSALAQTYEVPPELWDRPRTAAAIAGDESLKRAVGVLLAAPDSRFVIHHATGHESLLQAEELKSWLGALAIDPQRIILRNDLLPGATIKVEVTP